MDRCLNILFFGTIIKLVNNTRGLVPWQVVHVEQINHDFLFTANIFMQARFDTPEKISQEL